MAANSGNGRHDRTTPKSWKNVFAVSRNVQPFAGERNDEVAINPSKSYCLNVQVIEGLADSVSFSDNSTSVTYLGMSHHFSKCVLMAQNHI